MTIYEEYDVLMDVSSIVERFRAGDFCLFEDEREILEDFFDRFFAAAEDNGYVALEDFAKLMEFVDLAWGANRYGDANSEAAWNLIAGMFIRCAEMQNRLSKQ